MTETIYIEVKNKYEDLKGKRRVSVSRMLSILGVSRSGYNSWLHRLPSNQQKRRQLVKEKIKEIYNKSYQNYGAPKIAKEIQKTGEKISERTVGKYMNELEIRAQYVKPFTVTTKDSDFSSKLENILNEQFNPIAPNAVWCTDITYRAPIRGRRKSANSKAVDKHHRCLLPTNSLGGETRRGK